MTSEIILDATEPIDSKQVRFSSVSVGLDASKALSSVRTALCASWQPKDPSPTMSLYGVWEDSILTGNWRSPLMSQRRKLLLPFIINWLQTNLS